MQVDEAVRTCICWALPHWHIRCTAMALGGTWARKKGDGNCCCETSERGGGKEVASRPKEGAEGMHVSLETILRVLPFASPGRPGSPRVPRPL